MKIAIISDIHDNVWNLKNTLARLQEADIMLCLGDLCAPFIVNLLAKGFPDRPIHIIFGNNDGDHFRILAKALSFPNVQVHGEIFQSEIDGRRFFANHFNYITLPIAQSGQFDVVCFGHNHRYQVERFGKTLAINPGTLMGFDGDNPISASFVIYDTRTEAVSTFQLPVNPFT
jgi:hypothetical protein